MRKVASTEEGLAGIKMALEEAKKKMAAARQAEAGGS